MKNKFSQVLAFAIAFTLITLLSIPTTSVSGVGWTNVERAIQRVTQNTMSLAFTMRTTD